MWEPPSTDPQTCAHGGAEVCSYNMIIWGCFGRSVYVSAGISSFFSLMVSVQQPFTPTYVESVTPHPPQHHDLVRNHSSAAASTFADTSAIARHWGVGVWVLRIAPLPPPLKPSSKGLQGTSKRAAPGHAQRTHCTRTMHAQNTPMVHMGHAHGMCREHIGEREGRLSIAGRGRGSTEPPEGEGEGSGLGA